MNARNWEAREATLDLAERRLDNYARFVPPDPQPVCPSCGDTAVFCIEHEGQLFRGVSEYRCVNRHRWGRWTGKLLGEGELEMKYEPSCKSQQ